MNRKLQGEIDRLLKKVQEGVTEFDGILKRIYSSSSTNQKEKHESELKKEIKKLQRYRDQIKSWITSNDVKNKSPLVEARKLIETKMEQFKACEKETKTKPYSKEALSRGTEVNQKERYRDEIRNWIGRSLEELKKQIDQFEAEMENIPIKKRKSKSDRIDHLTCAVKRHEFHISNLETILRALDNMNVEPSAVEEIQDSVNYYVESNQDLDFYEDEDLYDSLEISADVMSFVPSISGGSSANGNEDSSNEDENIDEILSDKSTSNEQQRSRQSSNVSTPSSPLPSVIPQDQDQDQSQSQTSSLSQNQQSQQELKRQQVGDAQTQPLHSANQAVENVQQQPIVRSFASRSVTSGTGSQLAGINTVLSSGVTQSQPSFRAAVTGSVTSETSKQKRSGVGSDLRGGTSTDFHSIQSSSANSRGAVPAMSPHRDSRISANSGGRITRSPEGKHAVEGANRSSTQIRSIQGQSQQQLQRMMQSNNSGSGMVYNNHPPQVGGGGVGGYLMDKHIYLQEMNQVGGDARNEEFQSRCQVAPGNIPQQPSLFIPFQQQQQHSVQPEGVGSVISQGLLNERKQQEGFVHSGASHRSVSIVDSQVEHGQAVRHSQDDLYRSIIESSVETANAPAMLDVSLENIPQSVDYERRKSYVPRNACQTPEYFLQNPLPSLENLQLYEKFDTDTLFFVFYYQPGTYQQYLAAQELKKQSWRYHKKYLTWFQRHEKPKEITNNYEQGTYVYFDYETGWCQRKKAEFTFEYRYLEE